MLSPGPATASIAIWRAWEHPDARTTSSAVTGASGCVYRWATASRAATAPTAGPYPSHLKSNILHWFCAWFFLHVGLDGFFHSVNGNSWRREFATDGRIAQMQFKERLLGIRLHGHSIGDLADWVDGVERVFRLWKDGPLRVFNDRRHIGVNLKMQSEDQIIKNW